MRQDILHSSIADLRDEFNNKNNELHNRIDYLYRIIDEMIVSKSMDRKDIEAIRDAVFFDKETDNVVEFPMSEIQ